MRSKPFVLLLAALLTHGASAGEIRRCVSPTGETMFTNLTCPATSREEHVADYEPVPDSPVEKVDPAAYAAAASARRAQAAAEDAIAAAEAARYAYEDAAAQAQNAQYYDNGGYQDIWYPYYTGYGSNFGDHGRRHERDHDHGDHGHGRPHPQPHGMGNGGTNAGPIVVQQPQVGGRETLLSRTAVPQAQFRPMGFSGRR